MDPVDAVTALHGRWTCSDLPAALGAATRVMAAGTGLLSTLLHATCQALVRGQPQPCCAAGLDAETTLVVIVSKTFTTAETMLNARTARCAGAAAALCHKQVAWLRQHRDDGSMCMTMQSVVKCMTEVKKLAPLPACLQGLAG